MQGKLRFAKHGARWLAGLPSLDEVAKWGGLEGLDWLTGWPLIKASGFDRGNIGGHRASIVAT